MGIFRTTDPTQFDDIHGIIISETAPPGKIKGVATNIAICVGQFERGPAELLEVSSTGDLLERFGDNNAYDGMKSLRGKKFGRLRIARVVASDAVVASKIFDDGVTTDILTFFAKNAGAYGNNIKVTISDGSDSGKKYVIKDDSSNSLLPQESYDNVVATGATQAEIDAIFVGSRLVDVTLLDNSAEPATAAETALALGSDGTVADTDYQTAINLANLEGSGNVLFLDLYNATRNGYLKTHAANTQDKQVVVCGAESDDKATAIADVPTYRDSDGRIIYAYPYIETTIGGVPEFQAPGSWYASIISQTSPHIDPAFSENTQFLAGITDLKQKLGRSDYIELDTAGISAFEFDADIGFKIKNGVTTHIANQQKVPVLRRRMADFLTVSIAKGLKQFQNGPNSKDRRDDAKGVIVDFVRIQEQDGILPNDKEVLGGRAKLIDTDILNTDAIIAAGQFRILYKQRIYSSMRYIVLQAEIGTAVVVTEV